jgi:hypothetical protein
MLEGGITAVFVTDDNWLLRLDEHSAETHHRGTLGIVAREPSIGAGSLDPAPVGRPALASDLRALIRQMREANPLWGAPHIFGELQKLGIEVSQATVAKYLGRRGGPPSQSWRTFLTNHVSQLASIDFFMVPTAAFRVLFVFVVLCRSP